MSVELLLGMSQLFTVLVSHTEPVSQRLEEEGGALSPGEAGAPAPYD